MKQDVLIHGETIQENASHVDVIFILKNDINVTVRIVLMVLIFKKRIVTMTNKNHRGTLNLISGWEVNVHVDTDGHLNIYINNSDKSDIVECDTGQGDGIDGDQLALRFSTANIEDLYVKSN
jgi:hypothetical protein